jgi:EmrB/QacA subfamily drug resistance transporter
MRPSIPTPLPSSRKWWAMLGIGLGVFMSTLDSGIVNISLPTLVEQLDTTFSTIQWVVLSYLLVITSLMLGMARLGDMLGKKRVYTTGLVLFTLGSLLCGTSPGVAWLIGFRALQGTGAVMMTALGSAIITEVFPPPERGRALGIIGGVVSVGIALGPSIGGVLIGLVGWRSIFLVNLPVGVVTTFIVARFVPTSLRGQSQRFDVAGALILMATLACYALGLTLGQSLGFGDRRVLSLLTGTTLGLVAFLIVEMRVHQPMVDLSLFRNVLFGINLLMGFLVFIVMAGTILMPFFLTLVKGYPTEQVGLLVAAVPVSMGLVAPASGALSDRFGSRWISLIGLMIVSGACLLIGTLRADITPLGYVVRLAPLGVGFGMFQSPNNSAVMGAAPREQLGIASGLLALSRTLGQTSGLPLMTTLFTAQVMAEANLPPGVDITDAPAEALVSGVHGAFQIAALVVLAATILAAAAWRLDKRRYRAEEITALCATRQRG